MSIEDRYLSGLIAVQYPDAPVEPSLDGMQLAAGPSQTVSDAGAGRGSYQGYSPREAQNNVNITGEIKPYDPTVRERMADFLQAGFEKFGMDRYRARKQAQTLLGGESSNLPLNMGLADIVPFLGTGLQTEEAVRMGGDAVTSAKRGNYAEAAIQGGAAALGLIPGAVGTVKAGKALAPKAGEMVIDSMNKLGSPVQMNMMPDAPAMAPKPAAPVNDMGFYSAVEQAALNIQRKSGTGQAMLNDITKGQDVKLDEVKWIGLDDFLKGKKNVTREEVQQYIAANKVDIKEVTLGEEGGQKGREIAAQDMREVMEAGGTFDDDAQYALQRWIESDPNSRVARSQEALLEEKLSEAGDRRFVSEFVDSGSAQTDATRYGQYTLPGGENYREILLTLPDKTVAGDSRSLDVIAREMFGRRMNDLSPADQSAVRAKTRANESANFTSSHWNEKNVLAHIRVNDRVDADGKKMLLVEEVQSDWHQAGRDKGYKSDPKPTVKAFQVSINGQPVTAYETMEEAQAHVQRASKYNDPNSITVSEAMVEVNDVIGQANRVPDAPMKDTWYQLALKRVLKYAADNGYERVGLTTGKTNAERFDLSKQVDEIAVPTVNSDGTRSVRIDPIEGSSIKLMVDADGVVKGYGPSSNQFTGKKLNEVVGKEMAEKIMAADKETKFTGLDLSVGGEGMKKYYDEIYPQFLAKYGKKWGAKVGETYLPIYDGKTQKSGAEQIRFVDITPEMRQGVGKGQPLFSATAAGAGTGAATMQDKEKN